MKNLIIDRFENGYAICEDDNAAFFGIDISEVPQGAKEGDVLTIDDVGNLTVNAAETQKRKNRINGKMSNLKNKSKSKRR